MGSESSDTKERKENINAKPHSQQDGLLWKKIRYQRRKKCPRSSSSQVLDGQTSVLDTSETRVFLSGDIRSAKEKSQVSMVMLISYYTTT